MKITDWGLIDYESSVLRQMALVETVSGGAEETIVFCTHPPVVTLGRATPPEDVRGWSGPVVESSRGGRATYHGPNQLVIYPIVDLRRSHEGFGERDVHGYLRALERFVVSGLNELGVKDAEARTTKQGEDSLTGVWVGDRKIASIGIAVRKWVTYHGVAINVVEDPQAFSGIRPCGFEASIMTSLESVLGQPVDIGRAHAVFRSVAAEHLRAGIKGDLSISYQS